MAINPAYVGRTFEPSEPYEVSRVKIAEFATAVGEPSPLCRDRAAARAAGYPDVIAPPTFAIVVSAAGSSMATFDPGLGVNYAMIVLGEPSSLCRDRSAAQAAGYPDVIAPPTFAIVVTAATTAKLIADPGLGVNYAMVVHGEQSFTHSRPLHAGDVVVAQSTIESIKQIGSMTTMATVTEVRTVDGENVCTARSTLVERGS